MIVANLGQSSAAKCEDGQQGHLGCDVKWTAFTPQRLRGTRRLRDDSYFGGRWRFGTLRTGGTSGQADERQSSGSGAEDQMPEFGSHVIFNPVVGNRAAGRLSLVT